MSTRKSILAEVNTERNRQIASDQGARDASHSMNDWIALICAYSGRMADTRMRDCGTPDVQFRYTMVQVAALAVAAVEALDGVTREA